MPFTETAASMRRLESRYDIAQDEITDHMSRQVDGEKVDEPEFLDLLAKRQVAMDTMEAVVKFETKTAKAVFNEAK